jgi:hypothetical protein
MPARLPPGWPLACAPPGGLVRPGSTTMARVRMAHQRAFLWHVHMGWSPCGSVRYREREWHWMKGLMTIIPDGSYEVKSFATDTERNNVAAYANHTIFRTFSRKDCIAN